MKRAVFLSILVVLMPSVCQAKCEPDGVWSTCEQLDPTNAVSCDGYSTRLIKDNANPTTKCTPDRESVACNFCGNSVTDCQMSDWVDWSVCSATCGKATRRRTRHIIHHAQNGGEGCTQTEEVESCKTHSCSYVGLMDDCEDKERPQFLLLPNDCPNHVVYCPGNNAKGYVKSCPDGEAWDSRRFECVDEDDICEDGELKRHHRYGYGRYGRHGYGHRQPYLGFRPYGRFPSYGAQPLPVSQAYNPFSNYYPKQPAPAISQSQPWVPPQSPQVVSEQNYFPFPQQSINSYQQQSYVPQSQQQNYVPPPFAGPQQKGYVPQSQQQQQSVFPPQQVSSQQQSYFPQQQTYITPQRGFPQPPEYYQQQQQGVPESRKKFGGRGDPPSFLCQSNGEFRTGECNTYWKCHPGQQSQYIRCPNNQKFQESSATSGHCDPTQHC